MRKLLLCALLATLPACYKPSPVVPNLPAPCVMPATPPPPELHPTACGDSVCLTVDETRQLAQWIERAKELEAAVAGCSLVTTEPTPDAGFRSRVISTDPQLVDLAANAATVDALLNESLDLTYALATCGEPNAFYQPPLHRIVVCRELVRWPQPVQRFVIAHEIAHAYIDQRDVPYTGSQEEAADELATVLLIVSGRQMDVLDAGYWLATQHDGGEDVRDEHQSNAKRAWNLVCLEDGSEAQPMVGSCAAKFHRAARSWARLLFNDR